MEIFAGSYLKPVDTILNQRR